MQYAVLSAILLMCYPPLRLLRDRAGVTMRQVIRRGQVWIGTGLAERAKRKQGSEAS
jgi:hypothetical protein